MRNTLYYTLIMLVFAFCNQPSKQTESNTLAGIHDSISGKYAMHCKPKTSDKDWYTSGSKAPRFEGLEGINFTISSKNERAASA